MRLLVQGVTHGGCWNKRTRRLVVQHIKQLIAGEGDVILRNEPAPERIYHQIGDASLDHTGLRICHDALLPGCARLTHRGCPLQTRYLRPSYEPF